jgi:hypothetical protein
MSKVTVPIHSGAIPGLLAPGCPIISTGGEFRCIMLDWSDTQTIPGGPFPVLRTVLNPDEPPCWLAADEWNIDLSSPAGRDRCLRWLAEGKRCPYTDGGPPIGGMTSGSCDTCKGTGWIRAPHDCRHLSDLFGQLTPEQSAAALAWSVRSVAAHGRPLRGVLANWRRLHADSRVYRRRLVCGVDDHGAALAPSKVHDGPLEVDDTLERRQRAADVADLAAGYARIEPDGPLTLPALPGEEPNV